jgi:hypothetical protein
MSPTAACIVWMFFDLLPLLALWDHITRSVQLMTNAFAHDRILRSASVVC